MRARVAFVLLLVLAVISSAPRMNAQQDLAGADLSAAVLEQIDALIAEKESRTPAQQKIDSQLLYESRMEAGAPVASGMWAVETDLPYAADGHLIVDVRAVEGSTLASRLASFDVELLTASDDGSDLRVHLNIDQIEALAADPEVVFIQPRQAAAMAGQDAALNLVGPTGQGSSTSEGDVTHLAFAARGAFHVDGTGVRIGVISNGVSSLADSQARGDLGAVTVLPGQAGSGDEGTAMLEIVHDLAPGAQLFFATGSASISSFANNIRALRAAGCDIIVDDVFYFVETPFQDGQAPAVVSPTNGGIVIQAVKDVVASGALYFSSAGNSGNADSGNGGTWEGDFVDSGTTLLNGRVHKFGNQAFNTLTAANTDGVSPITLYWADPLGGSANDYDLFRLNAAGTAVAASSTNIQNGKQDPIEQISQNITNPRIVITKKTAALPRFLHLETNRGRLAIATGGATHGHAAVTADGAFGVAASAASAAFPQPFNPGNVVEPFSSDGPRRIFFDAAGAPITPNDFSSTGGQVLQKPDLTAADGVSVSGVGGFGSPFSGTSAAAPHAAAIAALVKAANPGMTAAQVRAALNASAIDIQTPGVDRNSGVGIVMARDALRASGARGDAFLQLESVRWAENPGNRDGVVEPGEGALLDVTVKNYGVSAATGISASFDSPTAGISIVRPSVRAVRDLAPLESAAVASPVLFSVAGDVGCATTATFQVGATYSTGTALAQAIALPLGVRTITLHKLLDGSTPPSTVGVAGSTGIQNFRLNRDGVVSSCAAPKATPTVAAGAAAARRFDAYTIKTCGNSAPACATVTLEGANATNLFTAAYVPTFDPNDVRQNYVADPGGSFTSRTYSFLVPGGGTTFAVDVHDVAPGPPSGTDYTLTVSGICTGSCDPPNHPPTVLVKDVTVAANARCLADASIDNGSTDVDGDPLVGVQSPAGPYALGTTPVLLTETDPKGLFAQASAIVTVVDQTAPTISGLAAMPALLYPPNHQLVDVTVAFDTADNCSAVSCVLTVSDSQARLDGDDHDNGDGDDDDGPDVIVVDAHHVRLRADRKGGTDRVYTLTVTCTDAAGNKTVRTTTVTVPHDNSDKDRYGSEKDKDKSRKGK